MKYENNESQRMLIEVAGAEYSLPVSDIECVVVIHRSSISPLPFDKNDCVRGLFSHNGSVVALLNCGYFKADSDLKGDEHLTAVILNNKNKRFGVLIDRAVSVTTADNCGDAVELNASMLYKDSL